jgi:GNAT superfamily N-acetyltransferase
VLYDGEPVGWFSYRLAQDRVTVEHGYLKRSHQRKKIGTILLNFIADEARKQRKKVVLEVLKNSTAKSFFDKTGFSESGVKQISIEMERS